VNSISFNSLPGSLSGNSELIFTLDITSRVAKFGRKILTPNAFKLTLDVNNYDIQNGSTAGGIAIGALLITAKAVRDKRVSNTVVEVDAPDAPSNDSEVVPIQDSDNDQDAGFFSYDKKSIGWR